MIVATSMRGPGRRPPRAPSPPRLKGASRSYVACGPGSRAVWSRCGLGTVQARCLTRVGRSRWSNYFLPLHVGEKKVIDRELTWTTWTSLDRAPSATRFSAGTRDHPAPNFPFSHKGLKYLREAQISHQNREDRAR